MPGICVSWGEISPSASLTQPNAGKTAFKLHVRLEPTAYVTPVKAFRPHPSPLCSLPASSPPLLPHFPFRCSPPSWHPRSSFHGTPEQGCLSPATRPPPTRTSPASDNTRCCTSRCHHLHLCHYPCPHLQHLQRQHESKGMHSARLAVPVAFRGGLLTMSYMRSLSTTFLLSSCGCEGFSDSRPFILILSPSGLYLHHSLSSLRVAPLGAIPIVHVSNGLARVAAFTHTRVSQSKHEHGHLGAREYVTARRQERPLPYELKRTHP